MKSLTSLISKIYPPGRSTKNDELQSALVSGDIEKARELLEQGATANYLQWLRSKKKYAKGKDREEIDNEIIKLFVKHGLMAIRGLRGVFIGELRRRFLIGPSWTPKSTETLELLLDHGLDIEDTWCLPSSSFPYLGPTNIKYTPLQFAVKYWNPITFDFLMKRGADIHHNPHFTCLEATETSGFDPNMIEFILYHGADVNQINENGYGCAPLHFLQGARYATIKIILEYGADLNILNREGEPALKNSKNKNLLVKELAKLEFKNQYVCQENYDCLRENQDLWSLFEKCLEELGRMAKCKFCDAVPVYRLMELRKPDEKLIKMTRRPDFSEQLEACIDRESLTIYADDLRRGYEVALERDKFLREERDKLYPIFENIFPDLVIQRIAFFTLPSSLPFDRDKVIHSSFNTVRN